MNRRSFMKTSSALTAASLLSGCTGRNEQPNILWITCEDISPHLSCYGDPNAITPNLDALAERGVRYTRAFATAPLCTPARSSLITGIFASTMGSQHLRGIVPLSPGIKCFTEYLRNAGYYCSNNVKEDYNFPTPDAAWDESSDTAHWRRRKPNQPFFSVFNFMLTHQSRTRYDRKELDKINAGLKPEKRHDPAKIVLPPYYPDTPIVRDNAAALHTQITLLDKKVQELLDQLEADGLTENTLVFFYSDHGDGLPRGKRWLHDTGIHVPLIIHFPKKYRKWAPAENGGTEEQLVSFADFAPTVLSLAGVKIPDVMQGKAFLGKRKAEPRKYIVAIRDRVDEVLMCSRTVRNERYHYIRNFLPHRPRMQRTFYSERTPIRKELRRLHKKGALKGGAAWLMQPSIPPFELYDTQTDPFEMNNLADAETHQSILTEMHKTLLDWMIETRDLGLLPEGDMLARAQGQMPFDIPDEQIDVRRILQTADLAGRGSQYMQKLADDLKHQDSAVRYWAATGLAVLGKTALNYKNNLIDALKDPSPNVRIAAAEGVHLCGDSVMAAKALARLLLHTDVTIRLHAAEILFLMEEKAKPALPEITQTIQEMEGEVDHGWYMREALTFLKETYL